MQPPPGGVGVAPSGGDRQRFNLAGLSKTGLLSHFGCAAMMDVVLVSSEIPICMRLGDLM